MDTCIVDFMLQLLTYPIISSVVKIEPFFVTLALYDAGKGVKISEDFHVDLNSPYIRQMVPPPDGTTDDGPHPLSQKATRATEVSHKHNILSCGG